MDWHSIISIRFLPLNSIWNRWIESRSYFSVIFFFFFVPNSRKIKILEVTVLPCFFRTCWTRLKIRKFEKERKERKKGCVYRGSMIDRPRRIEFSRDANIAPVVDTVPRFKFGPVCLNRPPSWSRDFDYHLVEKGWRLKATTGTWKRAWSWSRTRYRLVPVRRHLPPVLFRWGISLHAYNYV